MRACLTVRLFVKSIALFNKSKVLECNFEQDVLNVESYQIIKPNNASFSVLEHEKDHFTIKFKVKLRNEADFDKYVCSINGTLIFEMNLKYGGIPGIPSCVMENHENGNKKQIISLCQLENNHESIK